MDEVSPARWHDGQPAPGTSYPCRAHYLISLPRVPDERCLGKNIARVAIGWRIRSDQSEASRPHDGLRLLVDLHPRRLRRAALQGQHRQSPSCFFHAMDKGSSSFLRKLNPVYWVPFLFLDLLCSPDVVLDRVPLSSNIMHQIGWAQNWEITPDTPGTIWFPHFPYKTHLVEDARFFVTIFLMRIWPHPFLCMRGEIWMVQFKMLCLSIILLMKPRYFFFYFPGFLPMFCLWSENAKTA
jgi:hypothetical protein